MLRRGMTESTNGTQGLCECGCGGAVSGDFLSGHDQKLRIALEGRVGGLLSLRDLLEILQRHAEGESTQEELGKAVRRAFRGRR